MYIGPLTPTIEERETSIMDSPWLWINLDWEDILRSRFLVLETPPTLMIDRALIANFIKNVSLGDHTLAIEIRGNATSNALAYMESKGIIHIKNLSKDEPPYYRDFYYSRIFGKGKNNIYQFTDGELKTLYKKAINTPVKQIFITFHGVRMYTDAGRLRYYHLYGGFPDNRPPYGLDAVKYELMKDMKFPATKKELIEHEGWKVIPLNAKENIHLGNILSWIPDKLYLNLDSVINELSKYF